MRLCRTERALAALARLVRAGMSGRWAGRRVMLLLDIAARGVEVGAFGWEITLGWAHAGQYM